MDIKQRLKYIQKTLFVNYLKSKKYFMNLSHSKRILSDIKKLSLILLCIFSFLTLWVNRIKFHPDNVIIWTTAKMYSFKKSKKFPININGEKVMPNNFQMQSGYLFELSDTSLNVITKNGNTIYSEKHGFSKPVLKSGNVRSIIYDCGGNEYKITSAYKTLHAKETENKIISACVSDVGNYALVTESQRYLSELQVFNKNNILKYKYYLNQSYTTDVSLNSEGNLAAVSGVSASNGYINSHIDIFDFTSAEPKYHFEIQNGIVSSVKHLPDGYIAVIADKSISFINTKKGTISTIDYDNKILKFYDIDNYNGVCCCLSPSTNEAHNDEIMIFSTKGKQLLNKSTSENLLSIAFKGSKIIALTENKVLQYNTAGTLQKFAITDHIYKKALIEKHGYVYLMSAYQINKSKLNSQKI